MRYLLLCLGALWLTAAVAAPPRLRLEPRPTGADGTPLEEYVIHSGAGGKPSDPIPSRNIVGWIEPRAVADSLIAVFLLESEADTVRVKALFERPGTTASEKVQQGLRGELEPALFRWGSFRQLPTLPDGRFQFTVDRVHNPGKTAFVVVNAAGQLAAGSRRIWED